MKKFCLISLIAGLSLPLAVQAESMSWRCIYTESTYSAAFMKTPQNRTCPPSRCYYDIEVDADSGVATVNGTRGYSVQRLQAMLLLSRTATNVVMGGTDTAEFRIDTESLNFEGRKTTTPSVTVTTAGQCSAAN